MSWVLKVVMGGFGDNFVGETRSINIVKVGENQIELTFTQL